jgi:hypothetical protein
MADQLFLTAGIGVHLLLRSTVHTRSRIVKSLAETLESLLYAFQYLDTSIKNRVVICQGSYLYQLADSG